MITGNVPASELDPEKGLRAQDYLIDPYKVADDVINKWVDEYDLFPQLMKVNGKVFMFLKGLIANALREAYERGQKAQPTICEHYSPEKCGCVCERRSDE